MNATALSKKTRFPTKSMIRPEHCALRTTHYAIRITSLRTTSLRITISQTKTPLPCGAGFCRATRVSSRSTSCDSTSSCAAGRP
jgi:hypothetical protein